MARTDPSETAPLLAPPVVDPEAAAPPPLIGNDSQNDQTDGVKELGNRIYVLLPAVAIGVWPPSHPFPSHVAIDPHDSMLICTISSCCSLP